MRVFDFPIKPGMFIHGCEVVDVCESHYQDRLEVRIDITDAVEPSKVHKRMYLSYILDWRNIKDESDMLSEVEAIYCAVSEKISKERAKRGVSMGPFKYDVWRPTTSWERDVWVGRLDYARLYETSDMDWSRAIYDFDGAYREPRPVPRDPIEVATTKAIREAERKAGERRLEEARSQKALEDMSDAIAADLVPENPMWGSF